MNTPDATKPHPARTAWELAQRIFKDRESGKARDFDDARLDLFAPVNEQVDLELAMSLAAHLLDNGGALSRETAAKLRAYSRRAVLAAQEFPMPARTTRIAHGPTPAGNEEIAAALGARAA